MTDYVLTTIDGLQDVGTPAPTDRIEISRGGQSYRTTLGEASAEAISQANYTASTILTSASDGAVATNLGAAAIVTLTLWPATVGATFSAQRIANYAFRLDPSGSELIGEGTAGKYLELMSAGRIDLRCYETGKWAIVGDAALYGYEP